MRAPFRGIWFVFERYEYDSLALGAKHLRGKLKECIVI